MKGILDIQPSSKWDDSRGRYHVPPRYLAIARSMVGDLVLHRTTRRGSSQPGYIAFSKLEKLDPDLRDPSMHYAILKNRTFFPRRVPFKRTSDSYWEKSLNQIEQVSHIGSNLQGRSIRPIDEEVFAAIFAFGYQGMINQKNILRLGLDEKLENDLLTISDIRNSVDQTRRILEYVSRRPFRDANFRHVVLSAYEDQCAITRLKILNGHGRAEAEAAHIRAVAEGGPDVPSNGIALSSTCHWLFDRHLISVTDDYELLVSPNIPQRLQRLFPPQGEKVFVPKDRLLQPNSTYLKFHRETFESKIYT